MENDQQKRTSWGRPSAFVCFFICIAVIGLASVAFALELIHLLPMLVDTTAAPADPAIGY